ncbi:MAG TPA: cytochrome c [Anaerolineales bacterium]|nr:cytochrome c [Anaerolineales bacterium]
MLTRTIRGSILFTIITGAFLAGTTMLAQAASPAQDRSNGEAIFKTKCAVCHTIGGGQLIGPDLKGVTQDRALAWLSAWIKAPDKVVASGDPIATQLVAQYGMQMPNLGLSDSDVADVIAYFQSRDGTSAAPSSSTQSAPQNPNIPAQGAASTTELDTVLSLNGDAQYGEELFTGGAPLQNGGTHCMACHTVEGVAPLGGGALGPNLTHVYSRYGRQGLASALGTLPFPTMQGVFKDRSLTESEQADLLAFFQQADQRGQGSNQQNFWYVLGGGSLLSVMLLAGMLIFWPRQRMGIAQRLRRDGKL